MSWLSSRSASAISCIRDSAWIDCSYRVGELTRLARPSLESLTLNLLRSFPPLVGLSSKRRCCDFMSYCTVAEILTHDTRNQFELVVTNDFQPETTKTQLIPQSNKSIRVLTLEETIRGSTMMDAKLEIIISILGLQRGIQITNDTNSNKNSSGSSPLELPSILAFILNSLVPGGHFFYAEAQDASTPLMKVLSLLQEVGFDEIDVAWCADGMWLVGARRPVEENRKEREHKKKPVDSRNTSSYVPAASSTSMALPSFTPSTTLSLSTSFAATPAPVTSHASTTAATSSSSTSSPPPSQSSSGPLTAHLLTKLPLLFSRFDPHATGLLGYTQLQALCRAVGRPYDSSGDDDGEDSLWWTYQSIASPDRETGQVGITIEDLTEHFYKSHLWSLQEDLEKLRMI